MRRHRSKPWYADGVPFTCLPECGKCCNQPGGVVFLAPHDAANLAKLFDLDVNEWLERDCRRSSDGRWVLRSKQSDESCIYLDENNACTVYESKPDQCSAFPWWNENMRSSREWRKTVQLCPGLRHPGAETIPLPVIQSHLAADAVAEKGFRIWKP